MVKTVRPRSIPARQPELPVASIPSPTWVVRRGRIVETGPSAALRPSGVAVGRGMDVTLLDDERWRAMTVTAHRSNRLPPSASSFPEGTGFRLAQGRLFIYHPVVGQPGAPPGASHEEPPPSTFS